MNQSPESTGFKLVSDSEQNEGSVVISEQVRELLEMKAFFSCPEA